MAYDNVTLDDLDKGYDRLLQLGTTDAEMPDAMDRYAASLNASRAADNTSTFTKALAVGTTKLIANTAEGWDQWTGLGGTETAKTVRDWINPFYEEHVAKAAQGQWWTNPSGWAATVGTAVPQIVEIAALMAIPTPMSKYAAVAKLGGYASRIGGVLAENAVPMAAFTLQNTGDLHEALTKMNVDEDTASTLSKVGGMVMSAAMEPAFAARLVNLQGLSDVMAKNMVGQLAQKGMLQTVAKEIGITAASGLGMMTATGIANATFNQAFNEMHDKDPNWKPPEGYTPQSLTDSFISGSLLTGVARTGTRLPAIIAKFGDARDKAKFLRKNAPDVITPEMLAGTDPSLVPASVDTMSPIISQKGQSIFRDIMSSVWTDESRTTHINLMDNSDTTHLANYIRENVDKDHPVFKTGESPDLQKKYIRDNFGLYTEGPVIETPRVATTKGEPTKALTPDEFNKLSDDEKVQYAASVATDIDKGIIAPADALKAHGQNLPDMSTWAGMAEKKFVVHPPIADPVVGAIHQWGKNWEQAVPTMLAQSMDLPIGSPMHNEVMLRMKRTSLERSGLKPEIVDGLMSMKDELNPSNITTGLSKKLTGTQYMRYLTEIEGLSIRDMLYPIIGRKAADAWNPGLWSQIASSKILDPKTGKMLPIEPLRDPSAAMGIINTAANQFLASFPAFRAISDKAKINVLSILQAMRVRGNQATQMLHTIDNHIDQAHWRTDPWMQRGGQIHYILDIVSHLLTDDVGKIGFRKQWFKENELGDAVKLAESKKITMGGDISPDTIALLTKAYDKGKIPEAKRDYGRDLATIGKLRDGYRVAFNYGSKLTGLPFEEFRSNYLPRIWKMIENGMSIGEVKSEEYKRINAIADEQQKMMEGRNADAFFDLVDTNSSLERKYGKQADADLFQEQRRMSDKDALFFLHKASMEDDPRVLLKMYMQGAIKKHFFEDMAPMMRVFANDIEREFSAVPDAMGGRRSGEVIRKQLNDLYNEHMGFTPADMSVAGKMKLGSRPGLFGAAIDRGFEWADKLVGHKYDLTEKPTYKGLFNTFMKYGMLKACGFPFNLTMAPENLMQQSIAASVFGIGNHLHGTLLAGTKEAKAYREKLGLITSEHMYAEGMGSLRDKATDQLYDMALSPMNMGDTANRIQAASIAKVITDQVDAKIKANGGTITKKEMGAILFKQGWGDKFVKGTIALVERMLHVDHSASLSKLEGFNKAEVSEYLNGTPRGFSGILDATHDLYARGKWEIEGRRFFAQSVIDVANFVYSQGGGVNVVRASVAGKALATFLRFPSNWLSYMAWLNNPKNQMYSAMMRFWATTFILGGTLGALGVNSNQWLGAGPIPNAIKPFGPFGRMLNNIIGVLSTQAKSLQGKVISSPKDQAKYDKAADMARKHFGW